MRLGSKPLKSDRIVLQQFSDKLRAEHDVLVAKVRTLTPEEGGQTSNLTVPQLRAKVEGLQAANLKLSHDNAALSAEMSSMVPEGAKRDDVVRILQRAAHFNPSDPPAFLDRAIDVMEVLGPNTQPQEVKPQVTASSSEGNGRGEHNWPPIITLSEANGHFFQSGSADLPQELQSTLRGKIIERLIALIKEYKVDVIEVIGHTDEQPIVARASNLDKNLLPFLQNRPASKSIPSDNAGLGLARAASVVKLLRTDDRLKGLQILPLSGGQLIDVGDQLSIGIPAPAQSRRRIEIRLRRHSEEVASESSPAWPPAQVVRPRQTLVATSTIEELNSRRCYRAGSTHPHCWDRFGH